jgi:hypothetical protein
MKTVVLWYGAATNLSKLCPGFLLIPTGPDTLHPTNLVRDLGVYFNAELNMKAHIRRVAGACYCHLRLSVCVAEWVRSRAVMLHCTRV